MYNTLSIWVNSRNLIRGNNMQVIISTQYNENYNVDTPGQGNDYWKSKGGSDYKVMNIDINDYEGMKAKIADVCKMIEYKNVCSEEYVIDWEVQSDDWMSSFEKSQLEREGYRGYQEPIIYQKDGEWFKQKNFEGYRGETRYTYKYVDGDWQYVEHLSYEKVNLEMDI